MDLDWGGGAQCKLKAEKCRTPVKGLVAIGSPLQIEDKKDQHIIARRFELNSIPTSRLAFEWKKQIHTEWTLPRMGARPGMSNSIYHTQLAPKQNSCTAKLGWNTKLTTVCCTPVKHNLHEMYVVVVIV